MEILKSDEISVASLVLLRRCLALGHHRGPLSIDIRWPGTNLWHVKQHHMDLVEANPLSVEEISRMIRRVLMNEESAGFKTSLSPLREFKEGLEQPEKQKGLMKAIEPLARALEKELDKRRTRVQVALYADLHVMLSALDHLQDERESAAQQGPVPRHRDRGHG